MVNEFVWEKDPKLQVGEDGSSPDVVSSVIIREKNKGIEGLSPRKIGKGEKETENAITIVTDKGKEVIVSKRDVSKPWHNEENATSYSKWSIEEEQSKFTEIAEKKKKPNMTSRPKNRNKNKMRMKLTVHIVTSSSDEKGYPTRGKQEENKEKPFSEEVEISVSVKSEEEKRQDGEVQMERRQNKTANESSQSQFGDMSSLKRKRITLDIFG